MKGGRILSAFGGGGFRRRVQVGKARTDRTERSRELAASKDVVQVEAGLRFGDGAS